MPAKPAWYAHLDRIIEELRTSSRPFIDRPAIEFLLGVGRRRAQQIMAPCITERVGTNGLADRDALIARLRGLASSGDAFYEVQRRRKVAGVLAQLRKDRIDRPQLLVEAPAEVVNLEIDELPRGVDIGGGRIIIEFGQPQEALEKLLALAMAISNDYEKFERLATR